MTTEPDSSPVPPEPSKLPAPPTSSALAPPIDPPFDCRAAIWRWARILLARNPFYIISAGLLLWSMRRLSLDSRIFPDELPQLLFNFSAFQFYELLLAGTAIILARRRVWYDSGLLVGLDNLFICVPFLLVSQALLLENWIAFALCLAGCALALLRVGAMRRWLGELNMPAPLLWSGAFLLCFNFAWPVLIRWLHKDVAVPSWDDRGSTLLSLQWNWIIPASVALGVLLPARPFAPALPHGEEAPFYSWRSFPLLALLMWNAGTCVHLYCISYVYGLPWRIAWLAPAVWMTAWMLWWQADNFVPQRARAAVRKMLLFAPALVMLASLRTGRGTACLTLAVLDALAFGAIFFLRRERAALHLCAVSALLACGFLPPPAIVPRDLGLGEALWGGALFYMVGWAIFSARPRLGIAGGICLGFGLAGLMRATTIDLNFALQAALIFILLHSLRWTGDASSDTAKARKLCALYWLAHTIAWVALAPSRAIAVTTACGGSVLVVYVCARFILGTWGPRVIAFSAGAVLCLGPFYLAGERVWRAPDGLLALLGSFALFALGTLAALMKTNLLSKHPVPGNHGPH